MNKMSIITPKDRVEAIKPFGIQKGDIFFVKLVGMEEIDLVSENGSENVQIPRAEFDEYFAIKPKRQWGEWTRYKTPDMCGECYFDYYCNVSAEDYCSSICSVEYRTNGKKIEARKLGQKATASCNPNDSFDLCKGIEIACKRLDIKLAKMGLDQILNNYNEELKGL